ncbi:hypothetical protein [Algoriphagus aquimarinus]|uniref:hypothetical protein n=1 Tax=Algoriphagus aquimarinus TaxID=237018 RepID=UPI0030DB2BC8|tara:strand:- start:140 stop:1051 length:912 start_codon:yes stop_codon:yes gene_type:complete
MKKNLFKLAGLVISAMLLGACSQMATYENEDLLSNQEAAAKNGFNLTPYGTGGNENAMTLDGGGDYLTNCITEDSGDIFKADGDLSANWGGGPNAGTKSLTVEVWNTLTTIEYRFTLTSSNPNGNNLQYFDEVSGDWLNAGSLVVNVPLVISRALPIGWVAGDVITEQWKQVGGGSPLDAGNVSYTLIGECSDCEESFSYVDNGDNEAYVFTYIPAEDMSAAALVFTFAQGVAASATGLDGWATNGSTRQITMDLVACQEYTWTVDLIADCSGNSPNSNVWTDFKVNTVSKKGTLSDITESCN